MVNLLLQDLPSWCVGHQSWLRMFNGSLLSGAIGETIRRLTRKVAVDIVTDPTAHAVFSGLSSWASRRRMGAKLPSIPRDSGFTATAHKVALSLDVSSAFNTVHRFAVLQAVRTHFPSIAPWANGYRHESTLFTGSSSVTSQVIASARGVQQRDPPGPVLVAFAVHPVIKEARQAAETAHPGGIDLCSFFLDDGLSAGSTTAAASSQLSWHASGGSALRPTSTKLKSSLLAPPTDFHGCCWNLSALFKLLGAAIGTTEWCEDLLGRRVAKARALLTAIGKFSDAQGAFCLLRSCSGWGFSVLAAQCPWILSPLASALPTPTIALP